MRHIFNKTYRDEELCDLERDIYEAISDSGTDDSAGVFEVNIIWKENEDDE